MKQLRACFLGFLLAVLSTSALACDPLANPYRVGVSLAGAWGVVFCPEEGYVIRPHTYVLRWEGLTLEFRESFVEMANAPDKHVAMLEMLKKHGTTHISDQSLFDVYAEDAAEIAAAHPPPPVWKVAPLGSRTTRPAYPYTELGRSPYSSVQVPIGAPCDMWERFKEGASDYGKVGPGLVALCKRVE